MNWSICARSTANRSYEDGQRYSSSFLGCEFDITLALYAVNACARMPEMALRVTASIVGLTTSRDEKFNPILLDMVAKKNVRLSSAMCLAVELLAESAMWERDWSIGLLGK